jgi:four helix bundle protein
MGFKFEKLEVWQLALEYLDLIYEVAEKLPPSENLNLKSQIIRAGTSAALAIAEGSTGQTDAEQARFLGIAIRSIIESVACLHIIFRRKYASDTDLIRRTYAHARLFVGKLTAMRTKLDPDRRYVREDHSEYLANDDIDPFILFDGPLLGG